jgi:GMP synthase (glutamine-hydrolysing)
MTLWCDQGHRSIVVRTLITNDFMTGHVAQPGVDIPEAVVEVMAKRLLQVPGVARVAYDLTPKPPATTEWE